MVFQFQLIKISWISLPSSVWKQKLSALKMLMFDTS